MRTFEKYISARNVWKNRRWALLDTAGAVTSISGQLFAAIRTIPSEV